MIITLDTLTVYYSMEHFNFILNVFIHVLVICIVKDFERAYFYATQSFIMWFYYKIIVSGKIGSQRTDFSEIEREFYVLGQRTIPIEFEKIIVFSFKELGL